MLKANLKIARGLTGKLRGISKDMNPHKFALQPFAGPEPPGPEVKMSGEIARRAHNLSIRYEIKGGLADLVIAPPADRPGRRHGL